MRRKNEKIALLLCISLTIGTLAAGCGSAESISQNQISTEQDQGTEAVQTEQHTEREIVEIETEEPTELVEPETEEEVIAIGYTMIKEGYLIVKEKPSLEDWGEKIDELYCGDKVEIIGEYYNEEEQKTYLRVRLENGKKGYVKKDYIDVEE